MENYSGPQLRGVDDDMPGGQWDPYGYHIHPIPVAARQVATPAAALVFHPVARIGGTTPIGRLPTGEPIPGVLLDEPELAPAAEEKALGLDDKKPAPTEDRTILYVGIGVGVVAVVGLAWYMHTHGKGRRRR